MSNENVAKTYFDIVRSMSNDPAVLRAVDQAEASIRDDDHSRTVPRLPTAIEIAEYRADAAARYAAGPGSKTEPREGDEHLYCSCDRGCCWNCCRSCSEDIHTSWPRIERFTDGRWVSTGEYARSRSDWDSCVAAADGKPLAERQISWQNSAIMKANCGHPNHGTSDHDCGPFVAGEELTPEKESAMNEAQQANLGLATTRELLDELRARIEIDYYAGGGGLDYTTVAGRPNHVLEAP